VDLGQKSSKRFLLISYQKQLSFELPHSLAIDLMSQKIYFSSLYLVIRRKAW